MPSSRHIPSFSEVVECERKLLMHFDWDLMILIPAHFVKVYLANGVVFENENGGTSAMSKKLADKT